MSPRIEASGCLPFSEKSRNFPLNVKRNSRFPEKPRYSERNLPFTDSAVSRLFFHRESSHEGRQDLGTKLWKWNILMLSALLSGWSVYLENRLPFIQPSPQLTNGKRFWVNLFLSTCIFRSDFVLFVFFSTKWILRTSIADLHSLSQVPASIYRQRLRGWQKKKNCDNLGGKLSSIKLNASHRKSP